MIFYFLFYFTVAQAAPVQFVQGTTARIASLDPFTINGIDAYDLTANVVEALAKLHPVTKVLEPWLAESWQVDKKKNSFRLKIREGVKFHNGQTLTAEDVKFTFDAYFDPKF